jgi:hypothetical protein
MSPGDGGPFSVDGLVLGFVGALENGVLSGIGVWYLPVSTSPPGPIVLPVTFLEMSPAYGNLVNVWAWDDTPDWGGAHDLFSPLDVACTNTWPFFSLLKLQGSSTACPIDVSDTCLFQSQKRGNPYQNVRIFPE